jgi:hypothetical protein
MGNTTGVNNSNVDDSKEGFMIKMNINNKQLNQDSMTHGIRFKPKNRAQKVRMAWLNFGNIVSKKRQIE